MKRGTIKEARECAALWIAYKVELKQHDGPGVSYAEVLDRALRKRARTLGLTSHAVEAGRDLMSGATWADTLKHYDHACGLIGGRLVPPS